MEDPSGKHKSAMDSSSNSFSLADECPCPELLLLIATDVDLDAKDDEEVERYLLITVSGDALPVVGALVDSLFSPWLELGDNAKT